MTPLEKVAIASGCTLALGGYVGYKFRRLVERVKLRREAKRLHELQVDRDNAKLVADVKAHYARKERLAKRVLKPEVMPAFEPPVRRPDPFEQPIPIVGNDDYDDVVAALVGAGFKKRLAERAADACTEEERAGLEAWTAAAIRRASSMP